MVITVYRGEKITANQAQTQSDTKEKSLNLMEYTVMQMCNRLARSYIWDIEV